MTRSIDRSIDERAFEENDVAADAENGEMPAAPAGPAASPVARRLALNLGVDLNSVAGTGPRGRIVRSDVEAAAAGQQVATTATASPPPAVSPATAPPAVTTDESGKGATEVRRLSRVHQIVARRMAEAKSSVPEFTVQTEVDMERCLAMRRELKEVGGAQVPSVNDFVVKAAAIALRDHPLANGSFVDGTYEVYSRVNVGVAVASTDALIVPTIFDADLKPLDQIARESRQLAERARSGVITSAELAGGTFTVSNLGMFGVSRFTAVINPPQAGILAVGATVERMRVRDRQPAVTNVMELTLTCDHRILYGADAAQLIARIRELLEHPAALLLRSAY
jgi:pyruvate dehydrogenase E2 component (dihydrolipoamide acetyltransferase)